MTIDPTDARIRRLGNAIAPAAEELTDLAQWLRYQRDRARHCTLLLLNAARTDAEIPEWIFNEAKPWPDPTTAPAPGRPATLAALCGQINDLRAENRRLLELLVDSVNQGAIRHPRHYDRITSGGLSTWEDILDLLAEKGLAEGDDKEGFTLTWPEELSR